MTSAEVTADENGWFVSEIFWVRAAIALLLLNAAFTLPASRLERYRNQATLVLLSLSVVATGIGIALRWRETGQGPFLTLYEILVSNLFSLGLFFLLAFFFVPAIRSAAVIAIPFLAALGLWASYVPSDSILLPPTFDNPWLWAHVVAGKLFLGAALVATSLSVTLLLRLARSANNTGVPRTDELDVQVWRFASLAFVFDSAMLIAGAAWARDAWGRYWAWDPLETWALLTWLALAIVLHVRVGLRWPKWAGWAGMCFVFMLAFLTFFGVPFLSQAPHKGVM